MISFQTLMIFFFNLIVVKLYSKLCENGKLKASSAQ